MDSASTSNRGRNLNSCQLPERMMVTIAMDLAQELLGAHKVDLQKFGKGNAKTHLSQIC